MCGELKTAHITIDQLKLDVAHLRCMRYGRSSEQMDAQQHEHLAQNNPPTPAPVVDLATERQRRKGQKKRPTVRDLPDHLPRETVVHALAHGEGCTCLDCGHALRTIGQNVSEVLDYVPGSLKVIRHVRPKLACRTCSSII